MRRSYVELYMKEMDETTTTTSTSCWGTWEELLLACAVNRHGSKSWESVAMEIQSRTSLAPPQLLTPESCKTRYYQLQRRLVSNEESEEEKMIPVLLDELRKLRVQELKREVQRNDASIMSLQLKVKRLTEDRERSLREENDEHERTSDLKEREDEVRGGKAHKSSPEKVAVDRVSGGHENQSFKESNSTDPEGEGHREIVREEKTEQEVNEPDTEPGETGSGKPDPVREEEVAAVPVGEGSYNASSDTIVKESVVVVVEPEEKKAVEEGVGSREGGGDSAAEAGGVWESKEEERSKENSDVQSSVSLSRKRRRVKAVSMSSSSGGGDEREPLLGCFEIVKSTKYGSVFDRRLQSQKSPKYKSLIRQHMDLEIIKTRIDEGHYSDCNRKFLRDLLLLINNTLIFFPRNSDENNAALELRKLVSKRISTRILKPKLPLEPQATKPEPSVPSRKRSAIERKPAVVAEAEGDRSDGKKNTRERVASSARITGTNGTTQKGTATRNSTCDRNPASDGKVVVTSKDNSEVKTEKQSKEATADAKKRGAAELLDRIKRNSSSGGPLLEKLKKSDKGGEGEGANAKRKVANGHGEGVDTKRKGASERAETRRKGGSGHRETLETKGKGGGEGTETKRNGSSGGGTEQKRKVGGSNGLRDGKRDHGTRSEKRIQEEKSPAKRNVGRPPKRSAAAPTPPTKRKRNGEPEDILGSGSRPARKRTRRR